MTQQEELFALKQLIKKQQEQLAEKDEIIEKQNRQIEKQQIQIENMVQALLHARKKLFGPSTEATKQIEGQLFLFEEAQRLAEELGVEQKKITVSPYTRTPRKPGVRAEMLAGLPKDIEEYTIPEGETCSKCGGELKVVGQRIVRTEVEFEPAKLKVKQIIQQVAKCTVCGTEGAENPNCHFQKAAVPTPPLPHSLSTPSLIAQVMYQKFMMGLPFARQERDWYRMGLILPRNDMANWVIRCSQEWLEPVYWRIHKCLMGCGVLHMDETRIQCNKEAGKKASSESFIWVIRSAACEELQAAFFYYSRTRNGDTAKELLEKFYGYLVTDAYSGYEKAEHIIRSLCWAHVRRYYIDSIPLDNNGKELSGSKGAEGREFINLLFKVEEEIKDLSYDRAAGKADGWQISSNEWRPHGPSLMPFGRGLRKPPRWIPQMRNSPRHWDIPKIRRNIWKPFWKTDDCQFLTIYVKQISSRSQRQGGHGSLPTPRREQRQMRSFILWWKVPVPTN